MSFRPYPSGIYPAYREFSLEKNPLPGTGFHSRESLERGFFYYCPEKLKTDPGRNCVAKINDKQKFLLLHFKNISSGSKRLIIAVSSFSTSSQNKALTFSTGDTISRDNFMFGSVMSEEANCKRPLELVFGFPIARIETTKS